MPRAIALDPLHNQRFLVSVIGADGGLQAILDPLFAAGFTTCELPEYSADPVTYKEGVWRFERKYPSDAKVSDVNMTRGVVRKDTTFFKWLVAQINGQPYRADIAIYHFHRQDWPSDSTQPDTQVLTDISKASKIYKLHECFPTKVRPAGNLDAGNNEVNMSELSLALEWFEVISKE